MTTDVNVATVRERERERVTLLENGSKGLFAIPKNNRGHIVEAICPFCVI